jgi:hypothetical protein
MIKSITALLHLSSLLSSGSVHDGEESTSCPCSPISCHSLTCIASDGDNTLDDYDIDAAFADDDASAADESYPDAPLFSTGQDVATSEISTLVAAVETPDVQLTRSGADIAVVIEAVRLEAAYAVYLEKIHMSEQFFEYMMRDRFGFTEEITENIRSYCDFDNDNDGATSSNLNSVGNWLQRSVDAWTYYLLSCIAPSGTSAHPTSVSGDLDFETSANRMIRSNNRYSGDPYERFRMCRARRGDPVTYRLLLASLRQTPSTLSSQMTSENENQNGVDGVDARVNHMNNKLRRQNNDDHSEDP